MTKIIPNPHPTDGTEYLFNCPACKCEHWFRTSGKEPVWFFDGNLECPTVSPSIRVQAKDNCHFYLTNGQLVYLHDCTHSLAGKTVDLPDYEEDI